MRLASTSKVLAERVLIKLYEVSWCPVLQPICMHTEEGQTAHQDLPLPRSALCDHLMLVQSCCVFLALPMRMFFLLLILVNSMGIIPPGHPLSALKRKIAMRSNGGV